MDILAGSGLEPQLAIPVIVVVLGALLVYVFGFQKTEEPSYEHLAVLQSSSSYKNRSVITTNKQKTSSSNSTSGGTKPKANGHVVADKEKNGVIKKAPKAEVNKENKPPQQQQVKVQQVKKEKAKAPATKDKPADFESGDWIQATSRKDKKKIVKKEEAPAVSVPAGSPRTQYVREPSSPARKQGGRASPTKATIVFTDDDEEEKTIVLKEMELFQKQNHSTQTSPAKVVATPVITESSAESTPKKGQKAAAKVPDVVVVEEKKVLKENKAPEVKEVKEKVKEAKAEAKSNIAFDEMGDTWEEAKSRGAKKRTRTRKD